MTRQEFLAHVQIHPNQSNVWYDDSYTIQAISVPVLDNNHQDITSYLVLVQHITLPLPSGIQITLNIVARQLVTGTINGVLVSCYLFDVAPIVVSAITPISESNVNLNLLPAIDDAEFYDSPYNVLHGSIEQQRSSTYIMQSDRYKIGTLANPTYTGPLNISQLLSGSASLAHVQDSNYTVAGWINARYRGSKTDRNTYKTEPAIGGSIFQGAEFPISASISQLNYLQTTGQILYKELFFAGTGETPGFNATDSGYKLTTTSISPDQSLIYIQQAPDSTAILKIPKVGDLLKIESEIVKIELAGVNTVTNPPTYVLQVTRGYSSIPASHTFGTTIQHVSQVQIYNIVGSRLTGVPKGQIIVQQTGELLKLDSLGYVVSSSNAIAW